jgi:DNA mismatch repair ATPase MutS
MKFSLLYKNYIEEVKESDESLSDAMGNTLYDLSIDKATDHFCRNKENYTYFLEVLKKPLKTVEEIKYRQEILMDFISMPKLLEDLRLIFKSYDSLQSDWHEMRSSIYMYGVPSTSRGILDSTYDSLKITAGFARNTVSYFRSIQDAIEKYDVKSEGLQGIKAFCAEMSENESLDEISQIASYFLRDTIDAYEFKVRTLTDDTLTIRSSSLTETVEIENRSLGSSIKKLFGSIGKGKSAADDTPEIDMGEFHLEDARSILSEALYELYTVLSSITGSIYEFFRGLSGELSFYDTGLKYCRFLSSARLPMCLPHMLSPEENMFKANDLYDMQLILEGLTNEEIVSNDIRIEKDTEGLLFRGPNTSGKTSLLRAIGAAQIFAQAGLPVCASAASMSIRNAGFTQFSSSEKEFNAGDVAGRFEGEVQEVARILNDLVPYSMILLNETFQTTSYAEGAQGIAHILEVLPNASAKYIFVTRLMQLFDWFDPIKVKMMEFGGAGDNAYKVSAIAK